MTNKPFANIDCCLGAPLVRHSHSSQNRTAQGPWTDLALHSLGWKAFQDLCAHVSEEILKRPVEVFREAQDGGQDAVFLSRSHRNNKLSESATIQCKFTSKADRHLRRSDIAPEMAHIADLIVKGQANTYVLITNMPVDAPVAVAIKQRLRELGVMHPHVFGREFLTRVIRASTKLRALVPRVYGLGDLSMILDERRAEQTKALLGHMLPTLKVYVPTDAHVQAVHKLAEHGVVLLLGDPATGKSTIAAILTTTANDDAHHHCYKTDGPEELPQNWNPDETGGFFWIDDAFGPNQLREDFVDRWIAIMPKIQAAIASGNRFVLTSRRHIYEAAKPKLGSRNHPLFRDGRAVVDVGTMTLDERRQILYNHIKAGKQLHMWKSRVKPQLDALAHEPTLLPEIARRMADPMYTKNVSTAHDALVRFVREPKEHLLQIIRELSNLHLGALTLVFLHRGHMPVGAVAEEMQQLVLRHFGVDTQSLGQAILQLRDSFVVQRYDGASQYWTFKHPTIADAVSAILGETDGMVELYLRGTNSEAILVEVVCRGAAQIPDAVVIPEVLDGLLVERLAEVPDEAAVNRLLFTFLAERASDNVFELLVTRHPTILSRTAYESWRLAFDPKIQTLARANRLGVLSSDLREESEKHLENALFGTADTSFLTEDEILALIQPRKLLSLAKRIRDELVKKIPELAESIAEEADLDIEPSDNFDDLRSALTAAQVLFEGDDDVQDVFSEAESAIDEAIEKVENRKKQSEEAPDDDWGWEDRIPARTQVTYAASSLVTPTRVRSTFSDVDE